VDLILDTNGLSAVAEGIPSAVALFTQADHIAIPVVVLGEYRFGIAQSRFRSEYEGWLTQLTASCRVLDITESTAASYAKIRGELKKAGIPLPSNDVWIAALCREHGFPLLSRDEHFDRVRGLKRFRW
jgi:predicted nucleic acid-binding protein